MVNQQFDFIEQSKQDKRRAKENKSELLARYRQREQQQRSQLVLTSSNDHPTANNTLRSEIRRLRHQLKRAQVSNQISELREKLRITQQAQRRLKQENRALRQQNQDLQRENTDITHRYQAQQLNAAMTQRQINYVQAYFAQAGFLLQAAENRLKTARRHQQFSQKSQRTREQRKQLNKLTFAKKQIRLA